MLVDYSLQEFWRISRMVNILGADVTSGYLKIKIFRSQSPKEKALLVRLAERIGSGARQTVGAGADSVARAGASSRERVHPIVVPLPRG